MNAKTSSRFPYGLNWTSQDIADAANAAKAGETADESEDDNAGAPDDTTAVTTATN